jgi:hypothetical protein
MGWSVLKGDSVYKEARFPQCLEFQHPHLHPVISHLQSPIVNLHSSSTSSSSIMVSTGVLAIVASISGIATALAVDTVRSTNVTSPLHRRNDITCQTTDGSPPAADCQQAIKMMTGIKDCHYLNPKGSGCAGIYTYGQCQVAVCIDDGLEPTDPAVEIGSAVTQLQELFDQCQNGGRVGGIYNFDALPNGRCLNQGYNGYAHYEFIGVS